MDERPTHCDARGDAGAAVEQILRDLACPHCEYNLRGLRGPVLDCPECGGRCDVANLVAARWTRPWWAAPGLKTLQWPAVCAFLGLPVAVVIGAPLSFASQSPAPLVIAIGVVAGVWLWLMVRAMRLCGGGRGIALALLAHALIVAYFAGGIGVLSAVMTAAFNFSEGDLLNATLGVLWAVACGAVIWLARRGDRYMGEQCIRRYLRESARVSSADPRRGRRG